jgi:hypothetical protein
MAISEETMGCATIIFWIASGLSLYGFLKYGGWTLPLGAIVCFLLPGALKQISKWGDPE